MSAYVRHAPRVSARIWGSAVHGGKSRRLRLVRHVGPVLGVKDVRDACSLGVRTSPADCVMCRKTALRLVNGRIHLLTQKKQQHLASTGKEISTLLATGKYDSARIKVEGLLREERLVAAYEILDLFLELITQRMAVLERAKCVRKRKRRGRVQAGVVSTPDTLLRTVPDEMREAVTTVLYMSARASLELPELETIRGQLATKYGKELVLQSCTEASATAAGVNDRILALMSVSPPPADIKLRRLKELAEHHGVPFDEAKVGTSILGVAHDMVAVSTPGQAAAWTEPEPAPTEAELHPGTAHSPAPVADGYVRVTSPPVVPLPSPAAHHNPDEEEYPNAAAAARSAAKSAEKAAHAAAAAARMASPDALSRQEVLAATPEASEPQEESQPACDDDLPSTPSDGPIPPPAAAEDDLDELTRRFEELKRRM